MQKTISSFLWTILYHRVYLGIMKKDEQWCCFVLHEDGYWEQPCYCLSKDMTEEEFTSLVLANCGRKYFYVAGISCDPDCPEENIRSELP